MNKEVIIEVKPLPPECQKCKRLDCDRCENCLLRFPIIELPEEEIETREDIIAVIG